ncbi:thioesterase-like superfamily-domain-containing protein [Jackrogersella minutella]|nr:thioesterase-like superfamily-domain-containing protein [Jackrogersella minutella]
MTANAPLIPFSEATKVKYLGVRSYSANILDAFSVGQVPHGGYLATCILEAAREHMKPRNQPDAFCAHFEFLDRTEPGPAIILIEDVKFGQQLSTIHLTLYQHGFLTEAPWVTLNLSRKKIVAYVTCTDIRAQSGLSLPTSFALDPPPAPIDLDKASKHEADDNWVPYASRSLEKAHFKVRLWDNLEFYVPLRGQPSRSVVDVWLRLTCGERFTNSSLAFVADAWAHLVEGFRALPGQEPDSMTFPATDVHWYPTVAFNLDLKKGVPTEGADWLRMRVIAKDIRNGKLDMETLIYDKDGDIVALSNHVNLILSADRNLAKRKSKSHL